MDLNPFFGIDQHLWREGDSNFVWPLAMHTVRASRERKVGRREEERPLWREGWRRFINHALCCIQRWAEQAYDMAAEKVAYSDNPEMLKTLVGPQSSSIQSGLTLSAV